MLYAMQLDCDLQIGSHQLHRLAIVDAKGRPQGFMAEDQIVHALLQGRKIQLPSQAEGHWHVKSRITRHQLIQEREPALAEACRKHTAVRCPDSRSARLFKPA